MIELATVGFLLPALIPSVIVQPGVNNTTPELIARIGEVKIWSFAPSVAVPDQGIENAANSFLTDSGDAPPKWAAEAYDRLKSLSERLSITLEGDRLAVAADALLDAESFVEKLVHSGVTVSPRIGLDEDGAISMSWKADGLIGDLSIYGDGGYSYFVKRNGVSHTSDYADISGPLEAALVEVLVS